nr:craniofacial development protein 2-like [Aegilops tauschii subsp. strangulata]
MGKGQAVTLLVARRILIRIQWVRKLAEPRRIRLGSWNVGSLTEKLRELVDAVVTRGVDILCVQETKWRGQKAKEVEDIGFKLWYTGTATNINGVGILVNKSLKYGVVDVKRRGDRIILVKLAVGDLFLNVISVYAPQVGHNENTKREFWEGLEDMVMSVPIDEKLFIGGDLNGHVGTSNTGFEGAHGGFGYGIRNQEGQDVLSFALAYDMIVANTLFRKRKSHRVTFSSGKHSSQIDFMLSRREDIKEGPWEEGGDADNVWMMMATCIRKVASEEFGVSRGRRSEDKDAWWWNDYVQKVI